MKAETDAIRCAVGISDMHGDEVTLTGRCEAPGRVGIGFGECTARLLAATA